LADLIDFVVDTEPSNDATGVPLLINPYFLLLGSDYDEDSLLEGLFLEGPDTDQFIGPGGAYLRFPDGISQGNLDEILESPGYKGIVAGTVTISGISGNTRIMLDPSLPLYASTDYKLFLTNILEVDGETEISGMATVSFQTGSGAIEEVPTDTSTSVLATTAQASRAIDAIAPLIVKKTTPADHAIQQDISLEEIEVEFNKSLDASTVSADGIMVETFPATDHPKLSTPALGELATAVEVDDNKLKIKI